MTIRSVPPGFAPLLELLELEQPRVVTTAQLGDMAQDAALRMPVDLVVRRLRERGWLLPLATRGAWEFAPAARAGAFGSGDPLIELRAVLARDPEVSFAVAAESAAYLLGFVSRRPEVECVGAPPGARTPRSFDTFRVVRWSPATPLHRRDGLPVWSPATLLAFMAARPAGYHDWPNVGEWLSQAARAVGVEDLIEELGDRSASAWYRAAYLMDRGGVADAATALASAAPSGAGPYYLGNRAVPGRYHAAYKVIDSTGLEISSA
jgi:hypothetical protein